MKTLLVTCISFWFVGVIQATVHTELTPLTELTIGMSVEDFKKAFPNMDIIFEHTDDRGRTSRCLANVSINGNQLWSHVLAQVSDYKLRYYTYVNIRNSDEAGENSRKTLAAMIQQFGRNYTVQAVDLLGGGSRFCPLIIWNKGGIAYAFAFTQPDVLKKGEFVHCQLTVFSESERIEDLFTVNERTRQAVPEMERFVSRLVADIENESKDDK